MIPEALGRHSWPPLGPPWPFWKHVCNPISLFQAMESRFLMKILFQGSLGTPFHQKNIKIVPSEPRKTMKNLSVLGFFKVSQFSRSELICMLFSSKMVPRVSFLLPKSHTRAPKALPRAVFWGHQGLLRASFCCRCATLRALRLSFWHYMAAEKLNFNDLAAHTWILHDFQYIFYVFLTSET